MNGGPVRQFRLKIFRSERKYAGQKKSPALGPGFLFDLKISDGCLRQPSLRTRAESRETVRDAVLRWMIPVCAARTMTGSAVFSASRAFLASPPAIASSTLRTIERMRVRRLRLIAVRRVIFRVAFFAEVVLAMKAVP
jgi:hypothetical protein